MFYAVTVATKNGGYYNCLKFLCKKHNIKLVTLGWEEKWEGFVWRWKIYKDFLNTINNDDIVLWIDAYDVLIVEDEEIIVKKFLEFKTEIVFGIEDFLLTKMTFGNCDKPILNGGSHIGYVRTVKKLIDLMLDPNLSKKWKNDDQNMLNDIGCKHDFFYKYTKMDTKNKIFYIAGIVERFNSNYYVDGTLSLKNNPSIIHGNGGLDMSKYAQIYGCNPDEIENPDLGFKTKQGWFIAQNFFYINQNLVIMFLTFATFIYFYRDSITYTHIKLFVGFLILLCVYYSEFNWNNMIPFSIHNFCKNFIIKQKHTYEILPLNKKVCYENLSIIHDILTEHNIFFWLSEGTALGFRRDNDFIDWDDDLDIGIFSEDQEKFFNIINDFKLHGFECASCNIKPMPCMFIRKGEKVDVDITGKDHFCSSVTDYCENILDYLTSFNKIMIEGKEYNIPTDDYYVKLYGDNWRVPLKNKKDNS